MPRAKPSPPPPTAIDPDDDDNRSFFQMVSDPLRVEILEYLADHGAASVTDICEQVGKTQPTVSHHLGLLRVSGLLESDRRGRFVYYAIAPDRFRRVARRLDRLAGPDGSG